MPFAPASERRPPARRSLQKPFQICRPPSPFMLAFNLSISNHPNCHGGRQKTRVPAPSRAGKESMVSFHSPLRNRHYASSAGTNAVTCHIAISPTSSSLSRFGWPIHYRGPASRNGDTCSRLKITAKSEPGWRPIWIGATVRVFCGRNVWRDWWNRRSCISIGSGTIFGPGA